MIDDDFMELVQKLFWDLGGRKGFVTWDLDHDVLDEWHREWVAIVRDWYFDHRDG